MSNKNRIVSAILSTGLVLGGAGCASDTGNGALIGAGVGALAGGVIGHQSGHAAGGALIGGAVGAGTGALIGHASDKNKEAKRDAYDKGYYDAQRDNARATSSTRRDGYYAR
jgi:hypothetical protein